MVDPARGVGSVSASKRFLLAKLFFVMKLSKMIFLGLGFWILSERASATQPK